MTYRTPYYYSTDSEVLGQRMLVHVWGDGSITTMHYDIELSVYDAIERMQQQERIYKHFGNENAANRKKSN